MFSDVQRARKSPGEEKKDYMPFSCTELNQSLIDYARKHLNETEENRNKGLQELKEFVKNYLKGEMDVPEIFYFCYLRTKKFDVKEACKLVKKGAEFVEAHRSIFDRVDSEAVRKTIHSKVIGFLPYRDEKDRAILYVRSECWDPNELKADDVIFGSIVSLHVAGENPVNQVAGFVVIVDFNNLNIQQIVSMSNWVIFGLQALQKCCPCLVKDVHVVHTPAFVRASWKMVRPIITEKIRKRITFYKSETWDSLHRRISPKILPEELGGELGPYSHEPWASDIGEIEKKYYARVNMFFNRMKKD